MKYNQIFLFLQILSYNKGRLSKNEEKLEPVDKSTVFNDTDFDKFEEEFDFFSWQ